MVYLPLKTINAMGKVSFGGITKKPNVGKGSMLPQVYTFSNVPNPPLIGAVKPRKGKRRGKDLVSEVWISKEQIIKTDNSYRVEDILKMGKENFFKKVSPKSPIPIPDLDFTDEEKADIDRLVAGK